MNSPLPTIPIENKPPLTLQPELTTPSPAQQHCSQFPTLCYHPALHLCSLLAWQSQLCSPTHLQPPRSNPQPCQRAQGARTRWGSLVGSGWVQAQLLLTWGVLVRLQGGEDEHSQHPCTPGIELCPRALIRQLEKTLQTGPGAHG